jgi:6-phosphogluconolactonase (cycloisomerase 2 family)
MKDRSLVTIVLALLTSIYVTTSAQPPVKPASADAVVYAAVGPDLTQYDVDVSRASLEKRSTVTLPANVQEAVMHRSGRQLYVAWSNRAASYGAGGAAAAEGRHGVTAFRVNASGMLAASGSSIMLRSRPIHVTTDIEGAHLLVAYNDPSGVSVHRIQRDGTIGAEVQPPSPLDTGIYAHHVRVLPSNNAVVLVTRGNGPTAGTPEDPGALKVFAFDSGVLRNKSSIAPGGGYGFQARHIDFHPSKPWAFLTLERQNRINVFRIEHDSLGSTPLFSKTTLAAPDNVRAGQTTSTIHVHPNGRFVYVGNRASATTDVQGTAVSVGGENTIAVFSIDQETGEPTLIQTADTRGFHPRTFAVDSSGRVLVVGNLTPLAVRDQQGARTVPAGLSVFTIGNDGKLSFARKYDIEADQAAGRSLFWIGMASHRP